MIAYPFWNIAYSISFSKRGPSLNIKLTNLCFCNRITLHHIFIFECYTLEATVMESHLSKNLFFYWFIHSFGLQLFFKIHLMTNGLELSYPYDCYFYHHVDFKMNNTSIKLICTKVSSVQLIPRWLRLMSAILIIIVTEYEFMQYPVTWDRNAFDREKASMYQWGFIRLICQA